jgi:hypothetical protein
MPTDFLSPAQIVGYLAFVLGVAAFLQKNDVRLKWLNAIQNIAYVAHFILLDNPAAIVSCGLGAFRFALSVKYSNLWLAIGFIVANVGLGLAVMDGPLGLFPIVGSCVATWAVFRLKGLPMRFLLLVATACWLTNNILCGSIGGTLLEAFIGVANVTTIVRMLAARRRAAKGLVEGAEKR